MRWFVFATVALLSACANRPLQMPPGADWERFVTRHAVDSSRGPFFQLRPEACDGTEVRADYASLDESALVRFLQAQRFDVHVERQQVDSHSPELTYLFVGGAASGDPVALRVAVLPTPDEAGRALHEAILQRGPGAWGVHRSNLAVLGPIGSTPDDIAFAAKTKLACWGVLTLGERDEAIVVPGGYAEP